EPSNEEVHRLLRGGGRGRDESRDESHGAQRQPQSTHIQLLRGDSLAGGMPAEFPERIRPKTRRSDPATVSQGYQFVRFRARSAPTLRALNCRMMSSIGSWMRPLLART